MLTSKWQGRVTGVNYSCKWLLKEMFKKCLHWLQWKVTNHFKFNLDSSKQICLALFFLFLFFKSILYTSQAEHYWFHSRKQPSWLEGHLWHEGQGSRREAVWFRGVQLWEKGVLQPQLPTSRVMQHFPPQLPVPVYLSYNLFGANSTSFVQCQAQSVPACHWCPLAMPQYKH